MKKDNAVYGMYFEALQKEVAKEIANSLLAILNTNAGDVVKVAAIEAISKLGAGSNSITNCSISTGKTCCE